MKCYLLKFDTGRKGINFGNSPESTIEIIERLTGDKVKSIRELTESEIEIVRSGEYPKESEARK